MLDPDAVLELTEDGKVELSDTGDKHDVDRVAGRDVTVLVGSDVPPRFEHEEVYAVDLGDCEALVPESEVRSILQFVDIPDPS